MAPLRFHPFDETLLSRVEDAGLNAAAPPQQRWMDGWLVRTLPGKARRARCINAVAAGRMSLTQKLPLAAALYAQAGLPMLFRIHRFTQPPELDAELAARGWPVADRTIVMIRASLEDLAATGAQGLTRPVEAPASALPPGMEMQPLQGAAFAEAVGALRESPAEHRKTHALRLEHSPVPYFGYAVQRAGSSGPLGVGQFTLEGDLAGLYDVFTAPQARGQRLATAICERMLTESTRLGAKCAYLQVDAENAAAIKVYTRLGFLPAYDYHYREAPAA